MNISSRNGACRRMRGLSTLVTLTMALSGLALFSSSAYAQINIGGANPTSYTQNVDSLANTGNIATFQDNVTLTGFYAS
jgi:hypothetical protein